MRFGDVASSGSEPHLRHQGDFGPSLARTPHSRRRLSLHSARLSSSAFLRVVQRSASPSTSPGESSPTHRGALRTLAATRASRAAFVVPPHLDGFLLLWLAGLLHPAADHEVHRVSCPAVPPTGPIRTVLTDATPSRAFPSRTASTASPQPVAPSSFTGCARSTSRPCSTRESVALPHRCRRGHARCSHGLPFPGTVGMSFPISPLSPKFLRIRRRLQDSRTTRPHPTRIALPTSPGAHAAGAWQRLSTPPEGGAFGFGPRGSNILTSSGLLLRHALRRGRVVDPLARDDDRSRPRAPRRIRRCEAPPHAATRTTRAGRDPQVRAGQASPSGLPDTWALRWDTVRASRITARLAPGDAAVLTRTEARS